MMRSDTDQEWAAWRYSRITGIALQIHKSGKTCDGVAWKWTAVGSQRGKKDAINWEGYEERWNTQSDWWQRGGECSKSSTLNVRSLLTHFFPHSGDLCSAWSDYERNIATEGEKTSAVLIIYSLSIIF